MVHKFSNLLETIKTKADFNKWVEELTKNAETLIYKNRNEIYKNEVARELADLNSLKNAWDGMLSLREKSTNYDLAIIIDNKGYHTFRAYFPITEEERDKCREYREKRIEELGGDSTARSCVYFDECVWEVLNEKVYKDFSFAVPFSSYQFFEKVDYNPLLKKFDIARFK